MRQAVVAAVAALFAHTHASERKGKVIADGTPEELAAKIGKFTVEYYGEDHNTKYAYFPSKAEADEFSKQFDDTYTVTVRKTNLEDSFVELTGNRIGDNGFMLNRPDNKGGA